MKRAALMCILCLPALAVAADAPIGRLFLTPAERAALDVIRQQSKPPERLVKGDEPTTSQEDLPTAEAPAPAMSIAVQGYVKRNDGKGTVWVNGQAVQEKSAGQDFEVGRLRGDTDPVRIRLPRSGQTVSIKAGQRYDPASGKVVNGLGNAERETSLPKNTVPSQYESSVGQNTPATTGSAATGNPAQPAQ
jgi:hypothetical protein